MTNRTKQTAIKTIRQWCLQCGEGTPGDVRKCPHDECVFFNYRFGKRPKQKNEKS